MIVRPIDRPLDGEHVAAVHPVMRPEVAAGWHRRLNLYTGRPLTDLALGVEQRGRAGRLAAAGQLVSSGVVRGLEVALEAERVREPDPATGDERVVDRHFLYVGAGYGIAASGEDVVVPRPRRVAVRDLPVYAPAALAAGPGEVPPAEVPPGEVPEGGDPAHARRLWPALGELLDRGAALPGVGVLVLQPVVVHHVGRFDGDDPCERDPADDAFEDQQLVDGCRLVWYAWPTEWLLLPTPVPDAAADARWRNRIAHALFDAESRRGPDAPLPWAELGVPVGLLAFDAAWAPLWVDGGAVVREGGRPRRRALAPGLAGHRFLWRARVRQFAEQVAEHLAAHATDPPPGATEGGEGGEAPEGGDDTPAAAATRRLAGEFRFLPPVGVLPPDAADVRAGRDHFFPPSYAVQAVPVPLEQVELAAEESVALGPYDVGVPDDVRLLVPVPQQWFEPGLLQVQAVAPDFQQAIDQFALRRGRWLLRRRLVRAAHAALARAVDGRAVTYPEPDPDALEPEAEAADPLDAADPQLAAAEADFGTTTAEGATRSAVLEQLRADLRDRTPLRSRARVALDALPANVTIPDALAARVRFDADARRLVYVGAMPDADRDALLALSADAPYQAAVRQLHAESQADEVAQLDARGVEGFIRLLEAKVNEANDRVDFGFLRAQTDIYRLRQLMLGTAAATRLATSPALAGIAQGESALATQQTLTDFLKRIRQEDGGGAGVASVASVAGVAGGTRGLDADDADAAARAGTARDGPVRDGPVRAGSGGAFAGGPFGTGTLGGGAASLAASAFVPGAGLAESVPPRIDRPSGLGFDARVGGGFEVVAGGTKTRTSALDALTIGARQAALAVDAGISVKHLGPAALRRDVTEQLPIVGKALDFRTVTLAERLREPAASEAKSFSVASKFTVLTELAAGGAAGGIHVDDIEVPGFLAYRRDAAGNEVLDTEQVRDPKDPTKTIARVKEVRRSFAEIRASALGAELLFGRHDQDPNDGDEAAFFGVGVRAIDNTVATLRLVEGRVQAYKNAVELCQRALAVLAGQRAAAAARLAVVDEELAEARHDVAVARALLAEETARVAAINARRDAVVAEHVEFLVFARPRMARVAEDVPARPLAAAFEEAPAPACLARAAGAVPNELQAVVALLREAPVRWLPTLHPVLDALDGVGAMRDVLVAAKRRAAEAEPAAASLLLSMSPPPMASLSTAPSLGGAGFARAITSVVASQRLVLAAERARRATLDLADVADDGASWARAREVARDRLSLGDLVDGGHGRPDVSQRAARELEQIARVAACLYERFGAVLPAVRLAWAERLGQYDGPANLRNLASLPRWETLDRLDRRELQGLVDWLFARVDGRAAAAASLANDLVRVALLLASHAPVDRVVAGAVRRATPAAPGRRVELAVDATRVRVGMLVHLYADAAVTARGVVEDVASGAASARIVEAFGGATHVAEGARAHFVAAESPLAAAYTPAARSPARVAGLLPLGGAPP